MSSTSTLLSKLTETKVGRSLCIAAAVTTGVGLALLWKKDEHSTVSDGGGRASAPHTSVLLFGDSNTWGLDPDTRRRHPLQDRWSSIFASEMGDDCHVVVEGLSRRTIDKEEPDFGEREFSVNGMSQLATVAHSHKPLDLAVVMLGTNDVKSYFNPAVDEIGDSMQRMVDELMTLSVWRLPDSTPRVLLVCPASIVAVDDVFNEESQRCSEELAEEYAAIARSQSNLFLADANECCQVASDGVHLNAASCRWLICWPTRRRVSSI